MIRSNQTNLTSMSTSTSTSTSTLTSTSTAQASEPNLNFDTQQRNRMLTCDYLVVGAGTACLSFVDTLLTQTMSTNDHGKCSSHDDDDNNNKNVTIIIVEKNSSPGGHWTKSYPFVTLHQSSCSYGVNSIPLGTLEKDGKTEPYDMSDRATGKEVCDYYQKVVDSFPKDRVQTYFNATYEGVKKKKPQQQQINDNNNGNNDDNVHVITLRNTDFVLSNNGRQNTHTSNGINIDIICKKVVQCESNVVVPSMRDGVPFPIDKSNVSTIPLNKLPEYFVTDATDVADNNSNNDNNNKQKQKQKHFDKYLVIGAGKSGVDAITYLLEDGKIHPDQITWIISRSVWYIIRDGFLPNPKPGTKFWQRLSKCWIDPLLEGNSVEEAFLNMERAGAIGRLLNPTTITSSSDDNDGNGSGGDSKYKLPLVFKGAALSCSELENLRSIKNVVMDMGRVTEITATEVIFDNNDGTNNSSHSCHSIPYSSKDTLVIDCMVDNFFGYNDFDANFEFFNKGRIRLGPFLSTFNPSFTSAIIAFLEEEFHDDDVKNSFLYFVRGPTEQSKDTTGMSYLQQFLLKQYAAMKTKQQLAKYKPYTKFALASRTNTNSPHHHGCILSLLWAVFGPLRMQKKIDTFVSKMENGGYSDFPNYPLLPGRNEADSMKFNNALRKAKTSTTTTTNHHHYWKVTVLVVVIGVYFAVEMPMWLLWIVDGN